MVGGQHFAAAVGIHGGHHAGNLHGLDQPRGAVVTDAQLALHRGDRRLAAVEHKGHRFIVEGIVLRVLVTAAVAIAVAGYRDRRSGPLVGDVLQVLGRAPGLPVRHHGVDLAVVHDGAVDPHRDTGTHPHVEHVDAP